MNMLATHGLSFTQSVLWPGLLCRGVFLGRKEKREICGINYVEYYEMVKNTCQL
jgi:hypothetical protein